MKKSNHTPTVSSQEIEDQVFAKEIEIQRLSWFDALFSTIKADLKNGDKLKAQKLADLGQYLAQDFQHYSEAELNELLADKEGSLLRPSHSLNVTVVTPSAKIITRSTSLHVSPPNKAAMK